MVARPTGLRRLGVAAGVVVAVLLVDQLTKWWAVDRLSHGSIHLIGTLDLQLSLNTGSAFSLFQGQDALLVVVAVVLVTGLSLLVWRAPTTARAAIAGADHRRGAGQSLRPAVPGRPRRGGGLRRPALLADLQRGRRVDRGGVRFVAGVPDPRATAPMTTVTMVVP